LEKERRAHMKELLCRFVREEDAISTVEIVLLIVVLIGLVIIFKSQLTSLVSSILDKITSQGNSI
jgi:Flp pilus assembly pilin Flp